MPVTNFNILIIYITLGAVALATGYHTVFFFNNRTKLLRSYCFYLLSILIYCFYCQFRMLGFLKFQTHFIDEILQMIICLMYARFLGVALNLNKDKDKWSIRFLRSTPFAVIAYIVLLKIFLDKQNTMGVYVSMGIIRGYFFLIGMYLLIMTLRIKKSTYYYLIGSGAIVLIIFAIISTIVEFWYLNGNPVKIRGLSWLLMGFFLEIIFYSAAVGYRTKKESLQRIAALQKIVDQYDIIKQHEIDKLKAMFQSKEEERNRIVKDIHDEIGSAVSSIAILSNIALHDNDKKDTGSMLKEIRDNAASLTDKVDDIVWSMNPRHDNIESLLLRIRQFATPLLEAREIEYEFNYSREIYSERIDVQARQNIYYIIKEAVNNMIKYSNCNKAIIAAFRENNNLVFEVKDNGNGFDVEEQDGGNGLQFMQQRAATIGAELAIQSSSENGTIIKLILKNQMNSG